MSLMECVTVTSRPGFCLAAAKLIAGPLLLPIRMLAVALLLLHLLCLIVARLRRVRDSIWDECASSKDWWHNRAVACPPAIVRPHRACFRQGVHKMHKQMAQGQLRLNREGIALGEFGKGVNRQPTSLSTYIGCTSVTSRHTSTPHIHICIDYTPLHHSHYEQDWNPIHKP